MDGERFDALARHLSRNRSRREVLAVLAGALAVRSVTTSANAQGLFDLGAECISADQCAPRVTCPDSQPVPVFCADNGFALDGATNCCVGYGSECREHADCCGVGDCVNYPPYWDGPCPNSSWCQPKDAVGVVGHGYSCTSTSQCRQNDGYTVCEESVCCTLAGTHCFFDTDCCGAPQCLKPYGAMLTAPGVCG